MLLMLLSNAVQIVNEYFKNYIKRIFIHTIFTQQVKLRVIT